MDTMVNSAGSAEREMENIQGSLEFKLNRLGQTWTGVAQNIFNTDLSKGIVDGLTLASELVQQFTNLSGTFGALAIPGFLGARHRTKKFMQPIEQAIGDLRNSPYNENNTDLVNKYATALGNLTSKQEGVVVSTVGLNKEQVAGIRNYNQLVQSAQSLTITEWERHSQLKLEGEEYAHLTEAQRANTHMTEEMVRASMKNKIATEGVNKAVQETADTIQKNGGPNMLFGSGEQIAKAEKGVKGFAKNTAKEFKAMFSSGLGVMNFAMMFGPVIAEAASKLFDYIYNYGEHAVENAQEQLSEYQKINGEIDTLNQNYQETGARIQELESLRREGGLTLSEQSELVNLKAVNAETKLRIQQQRELARLQGEKASSAYQEAWEKQTFQSATDHGSHQYHGRISAEGGAEQRNVGYPEYVQELINSYRELNEERQKGNGLEKDEEERYNNTRQTMLDTVEDIGGYISAMEEAGDTSSKAYKEAKTAYENLNWELNPIDFFDAKMAELPQSATSALEDLGMQGQVTAGDIGKLIQRFPEVRDWMQKAGIDTEKLVESFNALSRISTVTGQEMSTVEQALTGVTNQFGLANGALKNYQTAIEGGDQDSNFKQYAAAYKAFNEEYENGRKHSNTFWESAELILGRDRLEELKYNVESVKKAMNEYNAIFSDDSGMAKGALDFIKNRNDLLDETGQKLIDIKQDGENIDIQIDPTKIGELADKLGVAKGTLLSWMDAWRTFANVDYTNIESMTKAIDEAGMAIETAGGKAMSIDAIRAEMESAGMSGEQIYNSIEKLKGAGYVFVDLTQDASTLADTFTKLNVATKDDAGNLTVNYEALEGVLRSIGFSSEDVVTALENLNTIDGITFEDSKGNIVELGTLIDQINSKTVSPDIDFDVGNVTSKLHELLTLKQRLDTMDATGVDPSSNMYTSVQQQISDVKAYIEANKDALELELGIKINPEDVVNGIMDGSIGSESDLASMFGLTPGEEGTTEEVTYKANTDEIDAKNAEIEGTPIKQEVEYVERGDHKDSDFSLKDFFTGPAIPDATTKLSDAPVVQSLLAKIKSAFSGGGGEKVEVPVTPKIEPADVTSAVTSATASSPVELPVSLDPTQIQTGLTQATETTPIKIPVEPDMTAFSTDATGTGTTLTPIKVPVEPDMSAFSTDTAGAGTSLAPIKVPVEPDFTAFAAGVSGAGAGIAPIRVPVMADPSSISNLSASIPSDAPPVMVTVNADPGPAMSAISAIPASIGTITIPATVKVTGGAVNAAQQVDTTAVNVAVNYTPNTSALPGSFPDISRMVNYIAQLAALPSSFPPITRIVNYVATGDTGGGYFAKGTKSAPGGPSLTGEEGPELVVSGTRAYVVGMHGPEIVPLKHGDQVFNARDTKKILRSGDVDIENGFPAFRRGTVSLNRGKIYLSPVDLVASTKPSKQSSIVIQTNTSKSKSNTTKNTKTKKSNNRNTSRSSRSSGRSSRNSGRSNRRSSGRRSTSASNEPIAVDVDVNANVNVDPSEVEAQIDEQTPSMTITPRVDDFKLEEKLKDKIDEAKKSFDSIIGNFEHDIFLMEKRDADVDEITSVYRAMMDETHKQAEKYREMGLNDDSDLIQELQKKWFEYSDAIKELITKHYEDMISEVSNSIKLLEFQMDELQNKVNNRTVRDKNWDWSFTDSGSNYDAILKNLDETIEKQREIQRLAHEGADEQRVLGAPEDSDEIRKFKDDWEGAAEAIVQAITTAYDAITGDLENRITLTENWLENAVKDGDVEKVKKYSDDIYDYYTQMQTAIHDEADRLRALGYSDTSEEVSKLSDLWWDYEEKRKTAAINAWKEIVDTAKDATDEVAGMYDTLKQAAKEYSSMGGYLTLDTLEKLLSMEPKYMQMLKEENGLWVIDEENVKKVVAAKMEDLAITNALAYVNRLRLALEEKSAEKLAELLYVTQDTANSTWDLVYAQLAALDLTDDQYDAALHNINVIRSMAHAAIEGIGKESDEYKKQLDEMKDGLDDLIKYVMDMLKHNIDEQVDSLEDMKDKYKEIIDDKKKSLDLTKKENDYQKGVRNKLKDMVKLQAQIESLRLDTSREAMAKRAQLEQQLVDIQEDVAETQADHAQELTEKALDENLKAYEDEKDDEIEALKKTISSEEKLYSMACSYIRDNWSTLYDELIAWNTEYGSVINDEIDEAWRNASAAVERYGGYLEAVKAVTQELKDITDSVSLAVGEVDDADYEAQARAVRAETPKQTTNDNSGTVSTIMKKIETMQENSDSYADDENGNVELVDANDNQKKLAKENERLAKEIQSLMPSTYRVFKDEESGIWYYKGVGTANDPAKMLYTLSAEKLRKIFEIHHVGGVAGNKSTVKQDEVFALLQKGEAIFTKDQQSSLMRILDFSKAIAGKFDSIAMNGANFLTGQLKDLTNGGMTPAYAGASNVSYDINVPVQIFPAQKMDESEIKSLTSKISDYTIKSINNDMGRRGIRGGTKRF